jgi:hypothetical protein
MVAMRPVDEFLRSVQDSFAANRATSLVGLVLVVAATIAIGWPGSVWLRRRRARRRRGEQVREIAARAKLSEVQLADLHRIAEAAAVPLLDLMTVASVFEHATAKVLAREPPTLHPEPRSEHGRVRQLRLALGFSPLSPHLWLLTTRELVAGDTVTSGGSRGHVAEVDEATFAVDWPVAGAPSVVPDSAVTLTIDRTDDARYLVRARVMQVGPAPLAPATPAASAPERAPLTRVFFAHDERPERQQHRAYMRLRLPATLTARLQIIERSEGPGDVPGGSAAGAVPASATTATIVDVSAGGLALSLTTPPDGRAVGHGATVRCWFALDAEATFDAIPALVVSVEAGGGARPGEQLLHLAFIAIEEARRDRLVAAITRLQLAARTPGVR